MTEQYAGHGAGCGLAMLIGIPVGIVFWFLAIAGLGRVTGWW
jgi:hypothetical protein